MEDDEGNKGSDSLRKWLKGDDSSLVSWLSGGTQAAEGEESFELRKRIMQLEDEKAQLTEELEAAREGAAGTHATLDDVLDARPSLRTRLERFRMRMDGLSNKLGSVAEQLCPETQKYIEVQKRIEALDSEMRGVLRNLLERPEALDQHAKEAAEVENKMEEETPALEAKMAEIEADVENKRIADAMTKEKLELVEMGREDADAFLDQRMKELENWKEERITLERENQRLRVQLEDRSEELNRLRSLLRYKEEELVRREEDLIYRERMVDEEQKRFASEKAQVDGIDELKMQKRLEDLRGEVTNKEEEIRKKESYLNSKMEELRRRELDLIEEEIDVREEDRLAEVSAKKAHTGNQRLNDLLLGGYPFGSSLLAYGPSFVGKEILVNEFVAEGLVKGVPALWVLTDSSPTEIRAEMERIISGYEEYEKLGLVKYVDAYSRTVDEPGDDPYTAYIESPESHDAISAAVDKIAAEFKQDHDYYRLGFRSLSNLIAYSDINKAFRFLSPFVGKRKKDRAVSLLVLEKGLQQEQEIQMLSMIVDGMLDFKIDNQRNFFAVKGITDVQTRNDVRYTWSDRGLNIGSFTLDHIK